jgi:hypothetical protein
MKQDSSTAIAAEAAFAADVYRDRAALNRTAQKTLAGESRQITIS